MLDEDTDTTLVEYLHMVSAAAGLQHGAAIMERFILDYGTDFKPARRPRGLRKQKDKLCFSNSTKLALARPGLTYCEGYANSIIPMHHAWCVTEDGTVVDPTWRNPHQCSYRGIKVPFDLLCRTMRETGYYGVLLDGYRINVEFMEEWKKIFVPCKLPIDTSAQVS